MEPPDNFPSARDFLADARSDFRQFYATATPGDAGLLDGLVMAHAAVVVGLNTPRDGLLSKDRAEVERACNFAEQKFSELREAVRACPTFKALIAAERAQIERDLFGVRPPWSME